MVEALVLVAPTAVDQSRGESIVSRLTHGICRKQDLSVDKSCHDLRVTDVSVVGEKQACNFSSTGSTHFEVCTGVYGLAT